MDNTGFKEDKEDNFIKKFKYYKANIPPPSLAEVINVDEFPSEDKVSKLSINTVLHDPRAPLLGLQKLDKWQMFTFKDHKGLILIRNPFTSLGQRYWIQKCLEQYPRKPNKSNIDVEVYLVDWWKECYVNSECNRRLLKKLRWTTLGYHHDWDTKVYSEANKTVFPNDLAELCDVIAGCIGCDNFRAEAAIVNYYHMNSTLSAHTDHSEVNLEAPLLSFSFGQSAIFLIGGKDKSREPSAVLLKSGDIMIMSKEARLCYHAVPKIIPSKDTPWNYGIEEINMEDLITLKYVEYQQQLLSPMNKNMNEKDWSRFSDYVEGSRINMNVRQVLNEAQSRLD